MEDEERAFIEYFNEIAKRIKEQGSEVKHWYKEITFSDALKNPHTEQQLGFFMK